MVKQFPNQVLALPLDVSNKAQIDTAIAETGAHFGKIDVLVNNVRFNVYPLYAISTILKK